jgi:FtsH-binding integral membrane protein
VLIFVQTPAGAVIYSILGLVILAGLTMADFQRLAFNHAATRLLRSNLACALQYRRVTCVMIYIDG